MRADEDSEDEDAVVYGDEGEGGPALGHTPFLRDSSAAQWRWKASYDSISANYRQLQDKVAQEEEFLEFDDEDAGPHGVVSAPSSSSCGEPVIPAVAAPSVPVRRQASIKHAAPVTSGGRSDDPKKSSSTSKPKPQSAAAFFDDMPAHWHQSSNSKQAQRLASVAQKMTLSRKRPKGADAPLPFPAAAPSVQLEGLRFAPSWLASLSSGAPPTSVESFIEDIAAPSPAASSSSRTQRAAPTDVALAYEQHSSPLARTTSTPSKHKAIKVGSLRWRLQKLAREAEAVDTFFSCLGDPFHASASLPASGLQDPRNRSTRQVIAQITDGVVMLGAGFLALRVIVEEIVGGDPSSAGTLSTGPAGACDDLADGMDVLQSTCVSELRPCMPGEASVVVLRDLPALADLKAAQPGQHFKLFNPIELALSPAVLAKCKEVASWDGGRGAGSLLLCTFCWELL